MLKRGPKFQLTRRNFSKFLFRKSTHFSRKTRSLYPTLLETQGWETRVAHTNRPPPKKKRSWVPPPPPQYDAYIRPSLLKLWKNKFTSMVQSSHFSISQVNCVQNDSRQSIFYMVHSTSSIQNDTLDINCNFSILILSTLPALQATILQWVRSDSQCGRLLLGLHDNTRLWQKVPTLTNIYFFFFLFFIFYFFFLSFLIFWVWLSVGPGAPQTCELMTSYFGLEWLHIVTFEDFKCRHSKWQAHQNFAQKKNNNLLFA